MRQYLHRLVTKATFKKNKYIGNSWYESAHILLQHNIFVHYDDGNRGNRPRNRRC